MKAAVLDTHILVWWRSDPSLLSRSQVRLLTEIETSHGDLVVSAISLWELAKLAKARRIASEGPSDLWLEEIEKHPMIRVEPLTARILATSVALENFHRDPADENIAATARCLGLPLITSDARIREWGGVVTV